MKIKLSLNRFSCLLFLFLPSAVHAGLLQTLVSSVFMVSILLTNPHASDTCPEDPKICFQNNRELKSAVADYIAYGKTSDAAQAYGYPIGTWCVSGVTDMSRIFYRAYYFNEDISGWDVSNVTNMSEMFYRAYAFNQDIGGWNVSGVSSMRAMFLCAYAFNQDISRWNVARVKDMFYMFAGASAFDQDISNWNIAGVMNMPKVFYGVYNFNEEISDWNFSQAMDMSYMFYGAQAFKQNLCAWGDKIQNNTNVRYMFYRSGCLYKGDPDLSSTLPGPFCAECTMTKPGVDLYKLT